MGIRSGALRRTDHQAARDSASRGHRSYLFIGNLFFYQTSKVIFIFPHLKQNTSCVCISDENELQPPNIDGRPRHQLCHGKYALISASQRVLPPSPFLGQLHKFTSRRPHAALCPWTRCGIMFLSPGPISMVPTCVPLTEVIGIWLKFSQRLHRQRMTPGSVGSVEVSSFRKWDSSLTSSEHRTLRGSRSRQQTLCLRFRGRFSNGCSHPCQC